MFKELKDKALNFGRVLSTWFNLGSHRSTFWDSISKVYKVSSGNTGRGWGSKTGKGSQPVMGVI